MRIEKDKMTTDKIIFVYHVVLFKKIQVHSNILI